MICSPAKNDDVSDSDVYGYSFFNDDPELPCFVIPEAIQPVTVFDLILNHASHACKKKPVFMNKAAVFLVDTTHPSFTSSMLHIPPNIVAQFTMRHKMQLCDEFSLNA